MLTSLRKSSSVSSFSLACSRSTQCTEFFFIFHLNAFLVPVCTRRFAYLFCWPRGRGIALVCTRRFSFHEFYNFLLFNFLIFIFLEDIFLPTTFTHTHDPRPIFLLHSLSWDYDVNYICAKANKLLGLIRRTIGPNNSEGVLTLVRPILEYGCQACNPNLAKHIKSTEWIQRRATRVICGS